jgi:hypothetical protein
MGWNMMAASFLVPAVVSAMDDAFRKGMIHRLRLLARRNVERNERLILLETPPGQHDYLSNDANRTIEEEKSGLLLRNPYLPKRECCDPDEEEADVGILSCRFHQDDCVENGRTLLEYSISTNEYYLECDESNNSSWSDGPLQQRNCMYCNDCRCYQWRDIYYEDGTYYWNTCVNSYLDEQHTGYRQICYGSHRLDNRTWLGCSTSLDGEPCVCGVIQCPDGTPDFSIDCGGTNVGGGIENCNTWFLQSVFPDAIHSCYDGPGGGPDPATFQQQLGIPYNPTGLKRRTLVAVKDVSLDQSL